MGVAVQMCYNIVEMMDEREVAGGDDYLFHEV